MTQLRIVLDNREHSLNERIQMKKHAYPNFLIEIAPLALGDLEVYFDNKLLYVWERKTLRDLLSSIADGRYKEQSHRLEHICGSSKVIYLIEGIIAQLIEPEKKLVMSAMTSLSLKKGFHIWRSVHVQDSADIILSVCDKIFKDIQKNQWFLSIDPKTNQNEESNSENAIHQQSYSGFVKRVKKDNITPDNIGEILLCQIPDVSVASAKTLMKYVHGDFCQFIQIIQNTPDVLYGLKIDGPKPRKISKKVFARLEEYFKKRPDAKIEPED